jgi:hypothetical protein
MYRGVGKIKRSEMVEAVANIFAEYIDSNISSSPRKMVDFILGEFENRGMKPTIEDGQGKHYTFRVAVDWEPEDEN